MSGLMSEYFLMPNLQHSFSNPTFCPLVLSSFLAFRKKISPIKCCECLQHVQSCTMTYMLSTAACLSVCLRLAGALNITVHVTLALPPVLWWFPTKERATLKCCVVILAFEQHQSVQINHILHSWRGGKIISWKANRECFHSSPAPFT